MKTRWAAHTPCIMPVPALFDCVFVRVQGASAYLTALQSAKAQGLHVRCEG